MATIKTYTDLEQSRKLAEFLPIESADMCWGIDDHIMLYNDEPYLNPYKNYTAKEYYIPCWSLVALIDILPSEFKYYEIPYKIDIRKYTLANNIDIYQIAYGNYRWYEDGTHSWSDMINTGEKENLIDAAFDMICWLKENNKI